MEIGYAMSAEEHTPLLLVDHAERAEAAGMSFGLISDHFHPWIDRQGQAPFVWGVLGAIATRTTDFRVGTGVTCPLIRMHPAIVAHAAATAAALMPGRFFLGVGTGENLNEHVLGDKWPPAATRRSMLREAVELMRLLWQGELTTHHGEHYTVENARLYTLPDEPIEVMVAAGGPASASLAGEVGDGLVATSPDAELVEAFLQSGSADAPRFGQLTICIAESEEEAVSTAHEWWPNGGLQGPLGQELALPHHFEEAAAMVSESDVAAAVVCGPDPEPITAAIEEFSDAGYTHVYLHQVGPDQHALFRLYEDEIAPWAARALASTR